MLPLQRVAWGLLLVVLDLDLNGWDVLADPIGWVLVLLGTARLGHVVGSGTRAAAVVALVVSVLTWPPDLLVLSAPLSWAASLPQVVFCGLVALDLARVLAERERTLRLLAWCFVVVGVSPPVVLVTRSTPMAVVLAGFAVVVSVWLVVVLLRAADEVPEPSVASGRD